jgi:arabinogalactan oligomer/maltooligosaccharide transport system substrate-binding protein
MKSKLSLLSSLLAVASLSLTSCGGVLATTQASVTETEAPVTEIPEPTETPEPINTTDFSIADPITITFWEQEESDEANALLDSLISDFQEANPAIIIDSTYYGNEALREEFKKESLSDTAPDVIRVPNDFAGTFSKLKILAPVDGLFEKDFLSQFFPGSLDSAKVAGTLWGVPDNYGNHLMLIYNKSLIAEPPATFEDLITISKELTVGNVKGFAYNLNQPIWGAGYYSAFGGWPLDQNDQPQFNNQAFIDYLTFVAKLKIDGVVPEKCDYACADTLMKEGKAAMIINGDWSLDEYKTALGDNLGVAPVPSINGKPYTEMTSGMYYMVSNAVLDDPGRQQAVTTFISFMTSPEAQKQWLDEFKRLPSNIEVSKDQSISSDPILAGSMAALSIGRGQSAAPEMRCALDAWQPSLEGVMAGKMTPAIAAVVAQESADVCVSLLQP